MDEKAHAITIGGLITWFRRRGFTQHIAGKVDEPHAIVLSRVEGRYIDVAHVRGEDHAYVARIPNDEHADIWAPLTVMNHYYGNALEALLYLRTLAGSDVDETYEPYEPPEDETGRIPLTVGDAERKDMKILPPLANLPS